MGTLKNAPEKVILIAEDDDYSYYYFEEVLKKTNCKTIRALNGKEAVELVKQNKNIVLILMDIQMPLMDGNEASDRIRKLRKNLPIIAQTAYIIPDQIHKLVSVSCNELLVKPISSTTLLEVVDHYISVN